jgi:hypothetical protein
VLARLDYEHLAAELGGAYRRDEPAASPCDDEMRDILTTSAHNSLRLHVEQGFS